MTEETQTIFGKRILVGLTYLDHDGNVERQLQLYGSITRLSEHTLWFLRSDNEEEYSIPFDGELNTADPDAIYTLKSTGEAVENVDFITSWTIRPPNHDR